MFDEQALLISVWEARGSNCEPLRFRQTRWSSQRCLENWWQSTV